MFLIALSTPAIARWDSAGCEGQARGKFESLGSFRRRQERYEHGAGIENNHDDLYWKMDTQDSVFAEREDFSTWGVAPPSRNRLAAHADQKPSPSRIRRIGRTACDENADHFCRVFADSSGKDHRRSPSRHVPLGETVWHDSKCRNATCSKEKRCRLGHTCVPSCVPFGGAAKLSSWGPNDENREGICRLTQNLPTWQEEVADTDEFRSPQRCDQVGRKGRASKVLPRLKRRSP